MATILICGHRSYAARGLKELLEKKGHHVLCFSRGEEKREGDVITGPVVNIVRNKHFMEPIDVVINFILIQNGDAKVNEDYMSALLMFCEKQRVKRLIQISSISSYPNDAKLINESSPTETCMERKGHYGLIKSAADGVLERAIGHTDVEIVLARPGYIVADDNPHPFKGVAKFVDRKFAILFGNKRSTLPCILRSTLHECLEEIATQAEPLPVYLLVEGENTTKYSYFKSQSNAMIMPLPKWLFILAANTAKSLHVIGDKTASGIKGVFKVQKFDNSKTKNNLHCLK